jgi:hypothetical protein
VAPGSPDKLRRTVFTPRNNDATPGDYYSQLEGVVNSTNPVQYANFELDGETVTSDVIFANLVHLAFRPPRSEFDGYSPTPGRKRFNFGAVLMDAGNRYLELHVEGKNTKSSGYKLVVDRMYAGSSATPREAELYAPTYKHPAYPYYYMSSSESQISGLRSPLFSGSAALVYVPTAVPSSMSFHLYNDIWCDTNFDAPPPEESTSARIDIDQTTAASFPFLFDNVVTMDKGLAWTASSAGNVATSVTYTTTASVRVPIYGTAAQKDYSIVRNGRWVRLHFERSPYEDLKLTNVRIHNSSNGVFQAATFGGDSTITLTTNNATQVVSDWIENWEIERDHDYELTYDIIGTALQPSGAFVWRSATTSALATVNGIAVTDIPALTAIETGYPDKAIYRSRPFDTQTDDPQYRYLTWTGDEKFNEGGDIDLRVRAGDQPDMSDANWTDAYASFDGYFQGNSRNDISGLPRGRYVQYEAMLSCGRGGAIPQAHINITPVLRDVTIEWQGARTLTDVVVDFGTGPDCGIVSATVDGVQLVRALEVEIEIYRDGTTKRETASGRIEVRPRNSGL